MVAQLHVSYAPPAWVHLPSPHKRETSHPLIHAKNRILFDAKDCGPRAPHSCNGPLAPEAATFVTSRSEP